MCNYTFGTVIDMRSACTTKNYIWYEIYLFCRRWGHVLDVNEAQCMPLMLYMTFLILSRNYPVYNRYLI
jgi:hypothetical protein